MASDREWETGADGPRGAPLSDLVRRLGDDGRALVELELALARAEFGRLARAMAISAAFAATGLLLFLIGLLVLLVFLVVGLGALLGDRYWLSALIVGSLFSLGGFIALFRGRRALSDDQLLPHQAIDTARETAAWGRHEARRFYRTTEQEAGQNGSNPQ